LPQISQINTDNKWLDKLLVTGNWLLEDHD